MKLRVAKKVVLHRNHGSYYSWHTIQRADAVFARAARRGARLVSAATMADIACGSGRDWYERCGGDPALLPQTCGRCTEFDRKLAAKEGRQKYLRTKALRKAVATEACSRALRELANSPNLLVFKGAKVTVRLGDRHIESFTVPFPEINLDDTETPG